ncbi:MAG: aspartate-semialdehyde dehydrogenase [Firmicutes bacterium HGW-Firmicutes-20]|nr:MAG: aspartate-semialdehyde dehydrogenase [Firmicutes bacterium HGW-Firmicutes-20]PKN96109.1 MAG: aspartate-semialdehyde dehydrogenase [Chloroflexi bacterium HGW-Chloroflexi-5]
MKNIAIVGATGMVGQTFIALLEEYDFPIGQIYFFASARSAGKTVVFRNKEYLVEELNEHSFDHNIDIALFSAGATVSKTYAPIAALKGVTVIDNSSMWRMDDKVPLVVPEVNPQDVRFSSGIIANPNCSTIQSVIPLHALQSLGLKRVIYTTFQAVSGSGYKGVNDLKRNLEGKPGTFYPKAILHNALAIIDAMLEDGYTKEEVKMIDETRKILHLPKLAVTATCVRIPVFNGHSVSINIELERPFELSEVIGLLKQQAGLKVFEDDIPTPQDASGQDLVYVGRIRRDHSVDNGLNLWVVADNIRKGAAANAIQIATLLMEEKT